VDKYKLEDDIFHEKFDKPKYDIFKGEAKAPGQPILYMSYDQHKKEQLSILFM
jgi:hypothetical protein